jgi:hypothetical protein
MGWSGGGSGGVADAVVKGLGPGYGLGWDTTSEFQDRPLEHRQVTFCYTLRASWHLVGVSLGLYFTRFAGLEGKHDKHLGM